MKDKKVAMAYAVFILVAIAIIVYALKKASRPGAFFPVNKQPLGTGITPNMSLPRGIRNNNPGNIRVSGSNWQGKVPLSQNTDSTYVNGQLQVVKAFEQFEDFKFGLRAMLKLLTNYQINDGLMTVREIINKWAPPFENNSNSYALKVANALGVSLDEYIGMTKETLRIMSKEMTEIENGPGNWITDAEFEAAYALL